MSSTGPPAHAPLRVDAVFDLVLQSVGRLLGGDGGSIMLRTAADELEVVSAPSNPAALGARVRFGEGVAGAVADTRDAVLVNGRAGNRAKPVDSGMCVPLLHDDELFAVMNVNAEPGRSFVDHDLVAATEFGRHAARALAAARLYEIDRLQGAATPERHLERMLSHLAEAGTVDFVVPQPVERVDAVGTARAVAASFDTPTTPTSVRGASSAWVSSRDEWLTRALRELVDNGHRHGGPPVRILVEARESQVVLAVADGGAGIPAQFRRRVFEPFARLDEAHELPGLGLGLTIVRRLVQASTGGVRIVDTPVGGIAVQLLLPVA